MTRAVNEMAETDSDWVRCRECRVLTYGKRFRRSLRVCPDCGAHTRLGAAQRLEQLLDPASGGPVDIDETCADPLGFVERRAYVDRHRDMVDATGLGSAVLVMRGRIEGEPVVVAVMDFRFMGGSMGSAEGEAVTTAAELALAERCPLLVVTASGGARMQEGALSLMQMAKTSNAFAALDEAGLLTVTLVTDPTYGGVAASFATLSDVILAEPGARMGFAGPRVIQQTIRQQLPEGFQTAEFLLERGLVDAVVPRGELRTVLGHLLRATRGRPEGWGIGVADPVISEPAELELPSAWQVVQLARHSGRPTALDHAGYWLEGFVELHGDRHGEDCPAIVGGIGRLEGLPVVLVGHQKGHTTGELVFRNFGMPTPAGYRKAARMLRLAEKLGLPVITLIDTPGAYPGVGAEERGQSVAIAENLRLMGGLKVPVVAVVTGEGGSGGALALGVADEVLMCSNAIYSVISPEGCAAILWNDPSEAVAAAVALRLDSAALLGLGVVDGVVPEPDGGAHADPFGVSDVLRDAIIVRLRELVDCPADKLVVRRRERFRQFGLRTEAR